jgi:hypothetical protein
MSLYFIPSAEWENHVNENGVNIYANASNSLDICGDNDCSPEHGGPYPFSEPETMALGQFLSDASIVIFIEMGSESVIPAGCPVTSQSEQLACGDFLRIPSPTPWLWPKWRIPSI